MIKILFHDGRSFTISDRQADTIREMKDTSKGTNLFTITDSNGRILCEEELKMVKGFDHGDPRRDDKMKQEAEIQREVDRLVRNKSLKAEWTKKFLSDNDYDGTILEHYRDLARKKMENSLRRQWVGGKFIDQMALALLRMENGCPIP